MIHTDGDIIAVGHEIKEANATYIVLMENSFEKMREALEADNYLIDRLWAAWLGKRVTDLDEAMERHRIARAALSLANGATERDEVKHG